MSSIFAYHFVSRTYLPHTELHLALPVTYSSYFNPLFTLPHNEKVEPPFGRFRVITADLVCFLLPLEISHHVLAEQCSEVLEFSLQLSLHGYPPILVEPVPFSCFKAFALNDSTVYTCLTKFSKATRKHYAFKITLRNC
ncbi:hypothetical protein ACTXT7_001065 [Hymenolepis weldensis]